MYIREMDMHPNTNEQSSPRRGGRQQENFYRIVKHLRPLHFTVPLDLTLTTIAKGHLGISVPYLSEILHGKKSVERDLAASIARIWGRPLEDLFFYSEVPIAEKPVEAVVSWPEYAAELRAALVSATDDVDIDFVGTDGAFLWSVLADPNNEDVINISQFPMLRRINASFMDVDLLRRLSAPGLDVVNPLHVPIAERLFAAFGSAAILSRADGSTVFVDAVWLPRVPFCCATRVAGTMFWGNTGFPQHGPHRYLNVVAPEPVRLRDNKAHFDEVLRMMRCERSWPAC